MEKNDPSAHEKYFIHQAGVYSNTPEQTTPFYSPIVAGIPAKSEVADLNYQFKIQKNRIVATMAKGANIHLTIKARPYANSYPLFLIAAADGRQQITSDLYYFSKLAYDGQTAKIDLLGFLDTPTSISLMTD